ncbi:MAG: class I SAM-dependent methyltransferase [Chloroflexi bacterium]|nr:class I SAM-dependent methyltransferase [Chloroflexota bacterium]
MDVRAAYAEWASTYDLDENPTRDLDRAATGESLSHFRCSTVLELGCGTGKNTAFLAQIATQVLALDFSEAMLSRARAHVDAANVSFEVADISRPWPCADHSVDLIVSNLVLEHVDDLGVVFAEAQRCLAPGGSMFVCELHPARQYRGTTARFQRGEKIVHVAAFTHHVSDFVTAAEQHGLMLKQLREWWRQPDRSGPPLLVSFVFRKNRETCAD